MRNAEYGVRNNKWRMHLVVHSAFRIPKSELGLEDDGFFDGPEDFFWIVDQLEDIQVSR